MRNRTKNLVKALTLAITVLYPLLSGSDKAAAADLEADAFPEFDIWISLDEESKKRLYILNSYANEPNYKYDEAVLGLSFDHRFHEKWSYRFGLRAIDKVVYPPDKNEMRAVFDLKWFHPLGDGWLLSDRNRLDVRDIDGAKSFSYRYRNRLQLEKPFKVFGKELTGFGSYEIYYDSRYNRMGQRHRFIGGVSVPITEWSSVDVFYGYHIETKPKNETGGALGIAFGFYF